MWRLSKAGHLKCYEYYGYFDDNGLPIVNKEDIFTLAYMDDLDERGDAHMRKEAEKKNR